MLEGLLVIEFCGKTGTIFSMLLDPELESSSTFLKPLVSGVLATFK